MAAPNPDRRSTRAHRAILDATRELLSELGWSRLTIESIAARAGVGKQTIYRWWPSKGAVVFDAMLAANTDAGGEVSLPDTGDVTADLRTLMRAVAAELRDPLADALQRAVLADMQHDLALANEMLARLLRPQLVATVARLRAAQGAGQLRPCADPSIGAELLFGPVFHRWLLRTGPLDDDYADSLVDHVLTGLAPIRV